MTTAQGSHSELDFLSLFSFNIHLPNILKLNFIVIPLDHSPIFLLN